MSNKKEFIYKEFDREIMFDLINGDVPEGMGLIYDQILETDRWTEMHEVIFVMNGEFFRTYYRQGLTEYQDEQPWDGEDLVQAVQVKPKRQISVKWEPV